MPNIQTLIIYSCGGDSRKSYKRTGLAYTTTDNYSGHADSPNDCIHYSVLMYRKTIIVKVWGSCSIDETKYIVRIITAYDNM